MKRGGLIRGDGMNSELTMSVSSMTRKGEEKAVYILFRDGSKTAEFALPECRLIRNDGFDENEERQLRDYVNAEQDKIYAMAREVNPLRAFMK